MTDDVDRRVDRARRSAGTGRVAAGLAAFTALGVAVAVLSRNDAFDTVGAEDTKVVAVPGAAVSVELGQVRVLEAARIDEISVTNRSGGAEVDVRIHRFRGDERTGIFLNGGCSTEGLPPRAEGSKRAKDLDVRRGDVLRVAAIVSPSAAGTYDVDGFTVRYRQGMSTGQVQRVDTGVVRVDASTTAAAASTCR